jgi:hypothetical protein
MGHEHIRPTRKVTWCITVPTGTGKMEIPVKESDAISRIRNHRRIV